MYLTPNAKTLLPRRVYHLYVSSYHSGTCTYMLFKVSGAPFTAATHFLPCVSETEEMVDIRLSADENWYRRRIWIWALYGDSLEMGEI